jgi:DnaK suppressor protein
VKAQAPANAAQSAAKPSAKTPAKTVAKPSRKTAGAANEGASEPAEKVLKAGSEVVVPKVNKRAAQAAMKAQMMEAVTPSHAPEAAKVTFTPVTERPVVTSSSVPMPPRKDPKLANNWKKKPLEELTDADMLAMPDGEYMNDVQLAFFRRKLQQLKQDMLANAGETTEHLREDTVVVPDPADRATIEEEHALELRTRDRERKLLKKIEQAIARIDAGDYGYCDETGEPIGVGRLLARPTASLSIEAQQRRELKQKLFGD